MQVISPEVRRRFILGKQGLWPSRRWKGKAGTANAMRAAQALQIDPVSVVAHSHDIVLWGRVQGYDSSFVQELAYKDRRFFDYGAHLDFYPMEDLPYWRPLMERRRSEERWAVFAKESSSLVREVHRAVRDRGPLRSRELEGNRVDHYRSGKDTGVALYFLWLVGELMTSRREGRERVFDLTERVAPTELQHSVSEKEAIDHFVRKGIAQHSLLGAAEFRAFVRNLTKPRLTEGEVERAFAACLESGALAAVNVEGSKGQQYLDVRDLPILKQLSSGKTPRGWTVNGPTTTEAVVFLSPLEFASARGRAKKLFDFDYTWEIYRPDHLRRYGPYTLPVLYGDRLVARIDSRLDRQKRILIVNGLWLEEWFDAGAGFVDAFARGLASFMTFIGADSLDSENLKGDPPKALRAVLRRAAPSN